MSIELENINVGKDSSEGGGSGDGKFPTIVTDSGSSLPVDLTGYNEGDTFLNTSDLKLYSFVVEGYELNTNVTNTATIDLTTGIATDFGSGKNIYRTNSDFLWAGNVELKIHFKETQLPFQKCGIFKGSTFLGTSGRTANVYLSSDNKIHFALTYYNQGPVQTYKDTEIAEISANVEYYLKIIKTGTSGKAELFTDSYNGTLVASVDFVTEDYIISGQTTSTLTLAPGTGSFYPITNNYLVAYLADSSGNFLTVSSGNWDSGTDLTDKTEYADKTNGILYLYENEVLNAIPNLEDYKKKAETITISTASVTIAEIKANKNYVFSNNAITGITLSGCETSFEETSIEFTLPADISNFNFIDNSGITWVDGSPTFNASKSYIIVIFNKIGFVKEY